MMVRDELGSLIGGMNQYKAGKGADRQWYLELWSNSLAPRDRKSDNGPPVFLDLPFMSIVGGIQPDVVSRLRGEPGEARPDDGFADRWLFAYPKEFDSIGETWLEVSDDARNEWFQAVARLLSMQMYSGSDGRHRPYYLPLDGSGREAWQAFTDAHAAETQSSPDRPDFPDALRGPWSKLYGYCARLSLIMHLLHAEDDMSPVNSDAVERATRLVDYFKSCAKKVYGAMGMDVTTKRAKRILQWISRTKQSEFKRHEAHKAVSSDSLFPSKEALDKPLDLLASYGYLRIVQATGKKSTGIPPVPSYVVNPLFAS